MSIVNGPVLAAALIRHEDAQKNSVYSQRTFDDIKHEKRLAQGKFLVADRQLLDPNFIETVVLLIHYGSDGAMGLVINRSVQIDLSLVFPDMKELQDRKGILHIGGPVQPNGILLLARTASPPGSATPVFGDVYLSSNLELLQRLIKNPAEEERYQIYAGYAGWAPDQLESEFDRGHWHVLNADSAILFDKDSSVIWQELIDRVSVKWVRSINPGTLLDQWYSTHPVR